MKISGRYIFIFLIFIGLLSLVIWQAIFVKRMLPNSNWMHVILQTFNPIWHTPKADNTQHSIPIAIKNPFDTPIIPKGTISLFDANTKEYIQNINTTFSGTHEILTNFLTLNHDNQIIVPQQEQVFVIQWKGF